MAKHVHGSQCTKCGWWMYPWLKETHHGNYELECGNCLHIHYRYIEKGKISERRVGASENGRIIMPKSATQKEKRPGGKIYDIRQLEAAGLHK